MPNFLQELNDSIRRGPFDPRFVAPMSTRPSAAHLHTSKLPRRRPQAVSQSVARVQAMMAIDVQVPGIVPEVTQDKSMACWAAAFTMLMSWYHQSSMDIEQTLRRYANDQFANVYLNNTGLSVSDQAVLFAIAQPELVALPPQSHTIGAYADLLRAHGPLWITTDERPGAGFSIHARILVGIKGDGTPTGTMFTFVDPGTGTRRVESVEAFWRKFEEVADAGPLRSQIIHFAARPSHFGRSASLSAPATSIDDAIQRAKSEGVSDQQLLAFLTQIGAVQAPLSKATQAEITVTLPGGRILSDWERRLVETMIFGVAGSMFSTLLGVPVVANIFSEQLKRLFRKAIDEVDRRNITVGIGPSLEGGLLAGGSIGAGILFAPGRRIGFYGSGQISLGLIASIGVMFQITGVKGGPENFSGTAVVIGGSMTLVEGPSIGVSILRKPNSGELLGYSAEIGLSVGFPVSLFAGISHTSTSLTLPAPTQRTPLAQAAADILASPNITLATTHVSGVVDNANARQNIVDTSNDLPAARSAYQNAPGGTVVLSKTMLDALLTLAQTYSFSISELAGGSHSANSRHYAGVAADVNTINGRQVSTSHPDVAAFMQAARNLGATEVLGPGNPGHNTHIHMAWPRPVGTMSRRERIFEVLPSAFQTPDAPSALAQQPRNIQLILDAVARSPLPRVRWIERGVAPIGYLNGMALTYARTYSRTTASAGSPDQYVTEISKASTGDEKIDALPRFAKIFTEWGVDVNRPGTPILRCIYTLLYGLGMRESSGRYCEGWDRSKLTGGDNPEEKQDPTPTNSEAGVLQISYDIGVRLGLLRDLYAEYRARSDDGFLSIFREGVKCKRSDAETFGSGRGAEFQVFSKRCPAFAVELGAVGCRSRAGHWGPLNRRNVEVRRDVFDLLATIEGIVDTEGSAGLL